MKLSISSTCVLLSIMSHVALGGDSLRQQAKAQNQQQQQQQQQTRQSVVRRLYGPENALVRRNLREVEERPERSRTGFLGDPNHKINYKNHPYDKSTRHERSLQDSSDGYEPMRIKFFTDALDDQRDSTNAAKIDFIKNEILPRTADFWSSALAVVPVDGQLYISSAELDGRAYCGDSEFTEVPSEHISGGVDDVDLILYVSGTPSTRFCSGTTLAVAVACNFDQYDRPTAGAINVCLDQIELDDDGTASEAIIDDNVDVLKHEVAHVLGHSSNSYRFYWDSETGTERTERPFVSRTVTCVDDVERTLILPDESTMKFATANNGQRYAAIVTPKVTAVARNQFNCQTLEGAKLENQPTGSDSCTGDHWDEHDYYPEALSGVISPTTNVMSHLTLALMEDSGWYRANYTMGAMNPWGLGAGCDFVEEPCLQIDESGSTYIPGYSKGYFCDEGAARGCSPALSHKMACTVIDYYYILPRDLPDERFQYFPNDPTMGGPRQADFCPVYGSTYGGAIAEELACTDSSNADSLNIYSEVYGSDSQCIPTDSGDGRCYRTACVKDEMALKINVRGEWLTCDYDFQELDVRVGAGALPITLVCPRLSAACPDLFCPFSCAGRGTCNFDNVVNGTVHPVCECFDSTDTSEGCSDSLIPDSGFLENADGLFDNIEEDFFDPLIAVFVDHPDKWTTSSWAWAAGLLAVFLVMLLCICSAFWPESSGKHASDATLPSARPRSSSRSAQQSRSRSGARTISNDIFPSFSSCAMGEMPGVLLKLKGRENFIMKLSISSTCVLLSIMSHVALGGDSLRQQAKAQNQQQQQQQQQTRQSVVRRLYGPENALVRRNLREVEERPERSRTGFLGDPNHKINYKNHPYDKSTRHERSLQDSSDGYEPMRIKFFTDALDDQRDSTNAAKIDFIKNEILPRTADFWSSALAVVPVDGQLYISSAELDGRAYCGDSEFTEVPSEHISGGVDDVDLILYVSGTPSTRFCSGTTLAVAVACNFDQYDRPTAGAINVCLDQIELDDDGTASEAIIDDNVDVLKHEVAHVLGHSSNSYRFYWDSETGTERTERPFVSRTVTCVDDVERTLILPDESTMKFATANNGQRYAAIVTPKVTAVARNQFNCQTLEGAKLENQPTGSDSCTGDHWDEHDYYPEALSGVISPTTNVMSHLTLALMEDSGWYRANYTMGAMNPWGLGAGCDFVEEPCLQIDESGSTYIPGYSKGYFCDEGAARGCSPALSHKMACTVIDYYYILPRDLPDERFQYFPNDPTMGGPRQADFCPVYGSTYGGAIAEELACTDSSNADSLNIYSEVYGSDSQCIPTDSGDGRCYRTACVKDEMALKINVRGEWLTCDYDFQELDVRVGAGALPITLVCPRLSAACPDLFCPFSCAGRGTCNFDNVVNGTVHP
eukprot:Nitzschia sp. Nitz4//scaffold27_size158506//200//5337//NITZ4_002575-RA/size158506-processed-gene-0.253-mRNA-1//-1//CDS//3329545413//1634//frame0